MVVAPTSTIDMSLDSGDLIPIETRASSEVCDWQGIAISPVDVYAENPAFDLTSAGLIDALVTEKGILMEPNKEKLAGIFNTYI
jgi:methylthioribose-1-phosphate isomerase